MHLETFLQENHIMYIFLIGGDSHCLEKCARYNQKIVIKYISVSKLRNCGIKKLFFLYII